MSSLNPLGTEPFKRMPGFDEMKGGSWMSGSPIAFKSNARIWGLFFLESLLVVILVYNAASISMALSGFDYVAVVLSFLCLPLCTTLVGSVLGRRAKKSGVCYTRPDWNFQPIQLKTEECGTLVRDYAKRYRRLVPVSTFWFFYVPVVLIVLDLSLPYYSFFLNPTITPVIPLLSVFVVLTIDIVACYGAFRASSNVASSDFTMPQIREVLWLARNQSKIANVSHVTIAMDKAQSGDFTIYRNPRVIVRLSGLENEAYIESWSEELRSLSRLFCRLRGPEGSWDPSWLWDSRDRNFLKRTPEDKEGYYVRNPVPSRIRELGVKDVRLVTKNAVALILIERLRLGVSDDSTKDKLLALGVEYRNA
jgi:hypothetical protein